MERKKGWIWKAFTTEDCEPKFARCLYCDKHVSRGNEEPRKQTTTNLRNHLKNCKNIEKDEYKKLVEDNEIAQNNGKYFSELLVQQTKEYINIQ